MSLSESHSQSFYKEVFYLLDIFISENLDYFLGVFDFSKSDFLDLDLINILDQEDSFDSFKEEENNHKEGDKEKKDEKKVPNKNDLIKVNSTGKNIEIKNEKDTVEFFIKAKNHNPIFYCENLDAKIGDIIEKYIQKIGEKKEIKNNFYYQDRNITDTEQSLKELEISHLSFIISY
jgi:hypothetical protein